MSKPNKTQITSQSVTDFLGNIQPKNLQDDCQILLHLITNLSNEKPKMWSNIIGFGNYHYKYESGREGDYFRIGFCPRKTKVTIYLISDYKNLNEDLAKLGKHKMGKSCLHINKLNDINLEVLTQIIQNSLAKMDEKYPRI
jgi:hypothetical protein